VSYIESKRGKIFLEAGKENKKSQLLFVYCRAKKISAR
jgi:hypothetical protein